MSEGRLSNHLLSVPTFDPEFHPRRYHAYPPGINNRTVLNKQALFKAGVEGAYMYVKSQRSKSMHRYPHVLNKILTIIRMPLAEISKPVKQMLLSGEFVPTPPPQGCGQNCSYSISFVGPAFKCNDMPEVFNLSKLTMPTTGKLNMVQYSYGANYIGRENTRDGKQFPQLRNMLERYNSDTFDFEVYFSTIGVDHDYMRGIRCEAWQGQYHLDITYVLGVQHVKAEVKK